MRSYFLGHQLMSNCFNIACGAVVALGSSGGSLVATPDCKTTVLGLNPAISPAYSGLPILRWAAIWDGTSL
jgi:hypothetical protein